MSETMERVWIRIPTDLKTALEGQAARRNLRFQDVARYALSDYVMNEVAEARAEANTLVDSRVSYDTPTERPAVDWGPIDQGATPEPVRTGGK